MGDSDACALTHGLMRFRRVQRPSIREQYRWEQLRIGRVDVLQRLVDELGLRIGDLAVWHLLAANAASSLVQRLVSADLARRESPSADRRAVSLHATDVGRARLQE